MYTIFVMKLSAPSSKQIYKQDPDKIRNSRESVKPAEKKLTQAESTLFLGAESLDLELRPQNVPFVV